MNDSPAIPGAFISAVKEKCPRCRSGKMFTHPIYSTKFSSMYSNCPVCGQDFEIEPGFYWGAMYVSYGFTILFTAISFISTYYLLNDPPVPEYVLIISIVFSVFSLPIFRYSRVIMLYLFGSVRFDPKQYRK